MSAMVTEFERHKAVFLSEYRALCQRHGLMVKPGRLVIYADRHEGEYSPFSLASLDEESLDLAILEMSIEPCRTNQQEGHA